MKKFELLSRPILPLIVTLVATLLLLWRNIHFWNLYSVNVLYYDQWDFWRHMFSDRPDFWAMFDHQHGPHKMGLGYLHLYAVAVLSDWNLRTESLSLIFVSLVTVAVFLATKFRLFRKWHYTDCLVPLAVMYFGHYEIYYIGTNPGLNVLPLLLVALIGFTLTLRPDAIKFPLLVALGFLSTYTGFAIFAGALVPVYCLSEVVRAWLSGEPARRRWITGGAFILSSACFASFFINYTFFAAVPNYEFPHPRPLEYIEFTARYWAYSFNLGKNTIFATALTLIVVGLLLTRIGRYLLRLRNPQPERRLLDDVILFLMLFSIGYSLNLAAGRISLGIGAGMTSRYLAFLVPLWIAIYFVLLNRSRAIARVAPACALGILLLYADRTFEDSRQARLGRLAENKRAWVAAYLEHRDIRKANEAAGFAVYPFEAAYDHQQRYLERMEEQGLGFFASEAPESSETD